MFGPVRCVVYEDKIKAGNDGRQLPVWVILLL